MYVFVLVCLVRVRGDLFSWLVCYTHVFPCIIHVNIHVFFYGILQHLESSFQETFGTSTASGETDVKLRPPIQTHEERDEAVA